MSCDGCVYLSKKDDGKNTCKKFNVVFSDLPYRVIDGCYKGEDKQKKSKSS